MAVVRYKNKPITPVDAVLWNGENLAEVQSVCPPAVKLGNSSTLSIPAESGPMEVYVGEYVMKVIATSTYTKLAAEVFNGLYMPQ